MNCNKILFIAILSIIVVGMIAGTVDAVKVVKKDRYKVTVSDKEYKYGFMKKVGTIKTKTKTVYKKIRITDSISKWNKKGYKSWYNPINVFKKYNVVKYNGIKSVNKGNWKNGATVCYSYYTVKITKPAKKYDVYLHSFGTNGGIDAPIGVFKSSIIRVPHGTKNICI